MKKITLFALALVAGFAFQVQAQEITLTQNTDQVLVPGGVSCGGGDNQWYREYDFGSDPTPYAAPLLVGVQFGIEAIDFDEDITVNVYDFTGSVFPNGFDSTNPGTPVATGTASVGPGSIGALVRIDFDVPAAVTNVQNFIVQIVQPTASGNFMFLGVTAQETKVSWISSGTCGIVGEPVTMDAVGFPDAHHVINLIIDQALAVGDNLAELASIFPNPMNDLLNVKLPGNVEVTSASLVDVLGRNTGVVYSNGEMNVSALAKGLYILNVETNAGTLIQKIVKN